MEKSKLFVKVIILRTIATSIQMAADDEISHNV